MVKLLCRLYDPIKGRIYWDGVNIKTVTLSELRQKISVIYQDFVKYHFPVGENIKISDLQQKNTTDKQKQAAKKSGAYDFIQHFPHQFDQQLDDSHYFLSFDLRSH